MKQLYAPWRDHYESAPPGCPFCIQLQSQEDEKYFILKRFDYCALFVNAYPYTRGHTLVIPYRHQATLTHLTRHERCEIIDVAEYMTRVVLKVYDRHTMNLGINLGGGCAGGSLPEHLHLHVVPRFLGDTGFLTTIAGTQLLSFDKLKVYQELKAGCDAIVF